MNISQVKLRSEKFDDDGDDDDKGKRKVVPSHAVMAYRRRGL